MHYVLCIVYYINPPLKDGLIAGFGMESLIYHPLVQTGVQNVVFFVSPPLVFLSKRLHGAGVASHLVIPYKYL